MDRCLGEEGACVQQLLGCAEKTGEEEQKERKEKRRKRRRRLGASGRRRGIRQKEAQFAAGVRNTHTNEYN